VSSEASASVVKIAATAQRRSSGGRPSMAPAGGFAAIGSEDIAIRFSAPGREPLGGVYYGHGAPHRHATA
jgi:hypothetical protein